MTKRKRKSGAHLDAETSSPSGAKRARQATDSGSVVAAQSVSYGRVDPTYGQRSAIPGLDDDDDYGHEGTGQDREGGGEGDDEVEYGVDVEALRYLRSVRAEASGIPTLLVAPRTATGPRGHGDAGAEEMDRGIYEDGVGDSRGWYEDGAYTAAPALEASGAAGDEREGGRSAQEVYYAALLERFEALRLRLAHIPPRHAVERLDADHGCYMAGSAKDYKMWRWRLAHTEPKPAQLAGMDKATVLRLLQMVGGRKGGVLGVGSLINEEGGDVRKRVSAWVWGLLARLPGRGELVSEEVGIVRELGKRAVWVGVEIKGVDMGGLEQQMGEGAEENESEGEEVVDVEVEGEDERPDAQLGDENFPERDGTLPQSQRYEASSSEPRNTSPLLDPPTIGPIPPESLRAQPSQHLATISKDDVSETPPVATQPNEAEALATARARLLARLGPLPDPQPHFTDDPVSNLLLESDETLALPHATAHEQKEYMAALQEQLEKFARVVEGPAAASHPLRNTLEERFDLMRLLLEAQKREKENTGGSGPGRGPVLDAAVVEDAGGRRVGDEKAEEEQVEEEEEEQSGEGDGAAGDGAERKAARKQGEEGVCGAVQATRALLDMIITIAGEVYGQRDLLEFREVWE